MTMYVYIHVNYIHMGVPQMGGYPKMYVSIGKNPSQNLGLSGPRQHEGCAAPTATWNRGKPWNPVGAKSENHPPDPPDGRNPREWSKPQFFQLVTWISQPSTVFHWLRMVKVSKIKRRSRFLPHLYSQSQPCIVWKWQLNDWSAKGLLVKTNDPNQWYY